MASVEDLISAIQKQSDISAEKINALIEDKCTEFSGMITKEAAVHLVAREMGVSLPTSDSTKLQIKNIVPGMRNVNVVGRVFKVSPINEFQKKNGEKGRVANVFISDGTGYTRVPLWNDQVKIVEDELIKIGDAIQVFGGLSKENMYGEVEISVGKFGGLRKIEDEYLAPSLEAIGSGVFSESRRIKIADLVPGDFEIKGTIMQVFRGNFTFDAEGGEKALVVSCVVDDGTGDIRAVFFRNVAEQTSGLSAKDLENVDIDARLDLFKRSMLGREIVIRGKVKKNKFFDALEIVADSVKDINPLEESKRIAEEMEQKTGA